MHCNYGPVFGGRLEETGLVELYMCVSLLVLDLGTGEQLTISHGNQPSNEYQGSIFRDSHDVLQHRL